MIEKIKKKFEYLILSIISKKFLVAVVLNTVLLLTKYVDQNIWLFLICVGLGLNTYEKQVIKGNNVWLVKQ